MFKPSAKALLSMTVFVALMLTVLLTVRAESMSAVWGIVESPNQGTRDNALLGLAINTPDDIWAVGEWNPGVPPTATGRRTLIEHWDGESWRVIPSPNP